MVIGKEIPPTGTMSHPSGAKLYILGEAPGEKENRAGKPFVGASGSLLWKVLLPFGFSRHHVRIANTFWRQPFKNNLQAVKATELHKQYLEKTREDIRREKPDVVLALGSEALECLCPGSQPITKSRGYWHDFEGIPVLPTVHPALVLRDYQRWYIPFKLDVRKAVVGAMNASEVAKGQRQRLRLHLDDFGLFEKICRDAPEYLALDIEVNANRKATTIIGLAWSKRDAVNVKITADNVVAVTELLKQALKRGTTFICHNAGFEMMWLLLFHQLDIGNPHDTMIMHHLLLMEQDKSLEFCASIWLNVPMWKFLSRIDELSYNAIDCTTTYELFFVLKKELENAGLSSYYEKHKRKELRPATFAGALGFSFDQENASRLMMKNVEKRTELESLLSSLVGDDFNPRSPKQLQELLYRRWGLPIQKEKGKVTTNEMAIKRLYKHCLARKKLKPFAEWLGVYLRWKKLDSLFTKELKIEPDKDTGKVHTSFNVAGTASSRWSSSKMFFLSSTNLQNKSKRNRAMFVPPKKGWVFVSRDYSGAEARVVAWRCNDEVLIEAFLKGQDIHKLTASLMFGCPIEEVTEELRAIGKRLRHAGNYDMSWRKLSQIMEIPASEAKLLMERYHNANPKIRQVFHKKTSELVFRTRRLINPFGLTRIFSGRLSDPETFRQAYAFYPQSTVTDALNKSVVKFYEWTVDKKWVAFQANVHDEAVATCEKEAALEVSQKLKDIMEFPIPIICLETGKERELVLPTDSKIGFNWGKWSEDNPEGMLDEDRWVKEVL